MMPPLKHTKGDEEDVITDCYWTDKNPNPTLAPATLSIQEEDNCRVSVSGRKSGLTFTMSKEGYEPHCDGGDTMILSDNGGLNYNKMYFAFAGEGTVNAGDVWNATTTYQIEWK